MCNYYPTTASGPPVNSGGKVSNSYSYLPCLQGRCRGTRRRGEKLLIIFGKSHPKQDQYDIEKDKLEAEIEEKYRLKYEKYENVTLKDYKMFQLINMLG